MPPDDVIDSLRYAMSRSPIEIYRPTLNRILTIPFETAQTFTKSPACLGRVKKATKKYQRKSVRLRYKMRTAKQRRGY